MNKIEKVENLVFSELVVNMPKLFVLTKNPKEYKPGEIFECMEIGLLDKDKSDNNYFLNFDILGHVEY